MRWGRSDEVVFAVVRRYVIQRYMGGLSENKSENIPFLGRA